MNTTSTTKLVETPAEPMFKIGQDVRLKTGGPEMIVNQCSRAPDGGFVVDTIWFGLGRSEERGIYPEGLLQLSSRSYKEKL
jgi:uncharacterized protein YodC (DUF2158 family)